VKDRDLVITIPLKTVKDSHLLDRLGIREMVSREMFGAQIIDESKMVPELIYAVSRMVKRMLKSDLFW
jgi:hypothetical protein